MNNGFLVGLFVAIIATYAIVNALDLDTFRAAVAGATLGLLLPYVGASLDNEMSL